MPLRPDSATAIDQHGFAVRFEWGEAGARTLAPITDVLIVVDVLSFTTAVDVAVARNAHVFPYPSGPREDEAAAFATRIGAILAVDRRQVSAAHPFSLSPASLATVPAGTRLVLPSPNGSAISAVAASLHRALFAGCLRNATAVAAAATAAGRTVGVIAAGERWPDRTLRPSVEDLLGAGAIIAALGVGDRSPEAEAAVGAFASVAAHLAPALWSCASGHELVALGFPDDVRLAAERDVSRVAPHFVAGAYTVGELTQETLPRRSDERPTWTRYSPD